jgi:hypothetical protein
LFYPSDLTLHKVKQRGGSPFLSAFGRRFIQWNHTISDSRSMDIPHFKGEFDAAVLYAFSDYLFQTFAVSGQRDATPFHSRWE